MTFLERLKIATRSGAKGAGPYLVSTLFVIGCFVLRVALSPWLAGRTPLMSFVAAVVLAAGLYGVGPGAFAMALSLIIVVSSFIKPAAPSPLQTYELASIAMFVITSGAMLVFADHLRIARRRALLLEVELRDVQSTAAMSTMAGTLAHELNQPLTAASNYLAAAKQFAGKARTKNEQLLKGLELAEAQIQRAGSVIKEARSLVRNDPVERKPTHLKSLIDRVIQVAEASQACDNVTFRVAIGTGVRRVHVNVVQIEQILLNLIRNSCQAMNDVEEPMIQFRARRAENGSVLEVTDNGPGIPRERLANLFSAARGSSGSGLGVGLSICRTIVEAHGGSIMAQNAPEGGASFFIFLPDEDHS